MKLILYTFLGFFAIALVSCRKSGDNITIQQFDQGEIQNYIQQNGITGMIRDTSGGDTTGIYYKVIKAGTGSVVKYSDDVTYVYTLRSFDGAYSTTDTILNHAYNYVGHLGPVGLQLSLKNILKRKGAKVRLLIPSRLAYGRAGAGSGTSTIKGNQCLDYTINLIDNQATYDDQSIVAYMNANGLKVTDYTKATSGLYYKVTQGTGTQNIASSIDSVTYTGTLLNGTVFDQTPTDGTKYGLVLYQLVPGFSEGLLHVKAGGTISMLIPSALAYGNNANSSGTVSIPGFSCLRFEVAVKVVTN